MPVDVGPNLKPPLCSPDLHLSHDRIGEGKMLGCAVPARSHLLLAALGLGQRALAQELLGSLSPASNPAAGYPWVKTAWVDLNVGLPFRGVLSTNGWECDSLELQWNFANSGYLLERGWQEAIIYTVLKKAPKMVPMPLLMTAEPSLLSWPGQEPQEIPLAPLSDRHLVT